jgi:hypothetical protein
MPDRNPTMMSELRKKVLRIVAIHEAAHVVVGQRHDMSMRYVTLSPRDDKSLGHVMPIQRKRPYHCHHIMPTYAAGAIAQDIATGGQHRGGIVKGAQSDLVEVRDCARLVRQAQRRGEDTGMELPASATVRKIAEVAWADAYRIVTAEYGAILAIADALLSTSKAITQADCRRIIAGAGTVTPPSSAHLAQPFWPAERMRGWWVLDENTFALKMDVKKAGRLLDGRTWDQLPAVCHA